MYRLGIVLMILVALFGAPANGATTCTKANGEDGWWQGQESIMGTEIRVELWHEDRAEACDAIAAVMSEMHRIDEAMSPYIESSLLSQLNRRAAKGPVDVGEELFGLIMESVGFSRLTNGAFDVTYASAGRYYNYRTGQHPDAATLRELKKAINYHNLKLNGRDNTISYLHEGVYIDLGGIAKGYAVDRGIGILMKRGIFEAMVSAGGDSRIVGDRRGEPWVVGIKHPRNADGVVAVLPLQDVSVSTSGDYERYFEQDGVRYHHIIDPKTGDSAREVASVTIIGSQATTTDALSTSVFVLGVKRGLELINSMSGTDAIIVDGKGDMFLSDSLMQMTEAAHLESAGVARR